MGSLADKITIVTGTASGIGRASARLFREAGARVVGIDLEASPDVDLAVRADVTDGEAIARAVEETVVRLGRLDAIFNVVGVSGRRWGDGPVGDCSEEAWDRVLHINAKSVFICCKHAVRAMLRGGGGSIINLSSVLALVGGDEDFATHAYAASKGAIVSLTKGIASYYAPKGIRANVICPGLIATEMSRRAQGSEQIRRRLSDLQPLTGDFGAPEDVARAALYLASDASKFVTGSVLTVDGGWTVR